MPSAKFIYKTKPTEHTRITVKNGSPISGLRRIISHRLGLENDDPVVLTFEIGGETAVADASRLLSERSASPEGLAAALYREIEAACSPG